MTRASVTTTVPRPSGHPELVWPGKNRSREGAMVATSLEIVERVGETEGRGKRNGRGEPPAAPANTLVFGDNLAAMQALYAERGACVDLIYIDPPFATGDDFEVTSSTQRTEVAYRDRWTDGLVSYLDAMWERLFWMRRLLSDRGTIFLHCDWRTSHWLRCLMDDVFGYDAFKNEIVWRYRRWPAKTRVFQRMHDVLLWYGKQPGDRHSFRVLYDGLAPSTLQSWGTRKQVADFSSGRRKPSQLDIETPGAPMSDVWDIGIIAPIAHERLGYPTQKPEALLRRVLEAASEPGDVIADFFCGSGTTLAVAQKLGRRWFGCDNSRVALHTTRKRLLSEGTSEKPSFVVAAVGETPRTSPGPRVEVAAESAGARKIRLALRGRRAALAEIDTWSVDWDTGRGPLDVGWWACRTRREPSVPLVTPVHAYVRGGARKIRVKIADAFGNETNHVVPVRVPG